MSTRREFLKQAGLSSTMLALPSFWEQRARSVDSGAVRKLQALLQGRVILPGDKDYEQARRLVMLNPGTDKHPAIIAMCKTEQDVARCLDFAGQQRLNVAVRSGGHSNLGWGTGDDHLVINVSAMKSIAVDPASRTVRVGAGVVAEELVHAAAKHGLAPVLGQCGSVGAGLALGGGLGWLSGKHGATCDNVLSANVITADSRTIAADSNTNADLYWAIRGGGGNFGIVTSFHYQLHPVGQVLAGGLMYQVRQARSVLRFYRDSMSAAADELQGQALLESEKGGSLTIMLVHSGDLREGEKVVERFRKFSAPLRDWVQRRPYADTYTMQPYSDDDGDPSCVFHAINGSYLESFSDEAIDAVLARYAEGPPGCEYGFDFDHYMHGQVCRVAPDATAFELRKPSAIHLAFGAGWRKPEDTSASMLWLDQTRDMLQPFSRGRVSTNYASSEGVSAAKAAYGSNYARIAAIKRKYDPDNVFRKNLNVLPK